VLAALLVWAPTFWVSAALVATKRAMNNGRVRGGIVISSALARGLATQVLSLNAWRFHGLLCRPSLHIAAQV
jgi:hypothetical protein